MSDITLSKTLSTLVPFLPEISRISSDSTAKRLDSSSLTWAVRALGKSILFITGIIVSPCFSARCKLARV